tara:strand:+ start:1899 stop:2888 length:990 start_codon:yes stop_codon:yes gene_type:complete
LIKKFAIIGLGSIGTRHLRLARALLPKSKIAIVRSGCGENSDEEKNADIIFYSLDDAIKWGIEAAVIANPAIFHIKQSIALMGKNIHILVEKPLSHSIEEINQLQIAQKKSNSIGLMGYCLRFSPDAKKFKEILMDERIGQILHVQVECSSYLPFWRKGKDYRKSVSARSDLGGGVLLELSHEIDYINWFFGEMKSVYAKTQNSGTLDIDVEDSAELIFESKQGYLISVHLDFNSIYPTRKCTVRCSKGNLIWDVLENKVSCDFEDGSQEEKIYENEPDYIYNEQLKHFFDCIKNKKQPLVSLEDGVVVLKMIEYAKKSNLTSKNVLIR